MKDPADDQKIAVTDYAEYEEVKALDEKHAEPNNLEDSEEDQNKTVGRRGDRNKEPYRITKKGPRASCRVNLLGTRKRANKSMTKTPVRS